MQSTYHLVKTGNRQASGQGTGRYPNRGLDESLLAALSPSSNHGEAPRRLLQRTRRVTMTCSQAHCALSVRPVAKDSRGTASLEA